MSCAILLTSIITAATVAATRAAPRPSPDRLVAFPLAAVLLLDIAAIFNIVALYHPEFVTNPNLWYPLIAMPPMLELCLISWPRLLPRAALGSRYDAWLAEQSVGSSSDDETSGKPSQSSPTSSREFKADDCV
jgi:hypothetical protein